MLSSLFNRYSNLTQHIISIGGVLVVAAACYLSSGWIGYKVVALILLMTVSVLAMLFGIFPVLTAAVLSAIIWNFFFIPPLYTFHINDTEDLLLFLMYFFIALLNAVLTFKIRQAEKEARDKQEKENTIKLYNTLLNSLSHEMRTPLATIIGVIDTLTENYSQLTDQNKSNLLNEINAASVRLNRQVENLLNMSRLESGILQLNKDWCDVNELIFSAINKYSDSDSCHTILFEPVEQLPLFRLDAGLIENVFHNLIHNAKQYTPPHTTIRIEAVLKDENLVVTITDNGKGFPEAEIKQVFEKFYRLPNSISGGTGLGLSIARGFVEAHHGTIMLENVSEGGARFTINIPAETSFITQLKNE